MSKFDVVVVGAGPAGIFTALELAKKRRGIRVVVMEKGPEIEERYCPSQEKDAACRKCSPCSIVAGWGGAGAFSDGKLTLSPEVGGMLDQYLPTEVVNDLISYVDAVYVHFGAPKLVYGGRSEELEDIERRAILADLKLIPAPVRHMGTGRTRHVLEGMRKYLEERGVIIWTRCPVAEIMVDGSRVKGVVLQSGEVVQADFVVVAPGRAGAEWLVGQANRLGLAMAINPVDIGVRVEVPAAVMEHLTRVIYEAKFVFYSKTFDDRVRTFCMNPHGEVVQENSGDIITVNGHTHADRKTQNTNFAILVSKTFTHPFKEPIAYGKYVARLANLLGGGVIVQRLGDLMQGQRSTPERIEKGLVAPTLKHATPGDLSLVFPYRHLTAIVEMLSALDKIAPGVGSRHTLLYGVEVKFYSSRLELSGELETKISNLFAAGDGAGVTRGLVQASASGVVAARAISRRLE
ncbi:MAG: NAD(P)/FAD-dependent oxidoreductase [Clostridia bacterium]|nr:NAD(P)/FAD-dependent oxidoreductase [Clostridia bacterium]